MSQDNSDGLLEQSEDIVELKDGQGRTIRSVRIDREARSLLVTEQYHFDDDDHDEGAGDPMLQLFDLQIQKIHDRKDFICRCEFCGKLQTEVKKLIAGPTVYICDECVGLCVDILAEDETE